MSEEEQKKTRIIVHLSFAVIFLVCIMLFKWINNKSIIAVILDLAGYTYGPLLGLFSFGMFTKRALSKGYGVTIVCLIAPALCYALGNLHQHFLTNTKLDLKCCSSMVCLRF
jgi:hypothetical protein